MADISAEWALREHIPANTTDPNPHNRNSVTIYRKIYSISKSLVSCRIMLVGHGTIEISGVKKLSIEVLSAMKFLGHRHAKNILSPTIFYLDTLLPIINNVRLSINPYCQ
jgi:hypothetical protein